MRGAPATGQPIGGGRRLVRVPRRSRVRRVEEIQLTARVPTRTDTLRTMSVQTLFDILLVLVALAVVWFASFTVLRLFKGQN
jgi:hypothetical protein